MLAFLWRSLLAAGCWLFAAAYPLVRKPHAATVKTATPDHTLAVHALLLLR
jgi:hypothetical protein